MTRLAATLLTLGLAAAACDRGGDKAAASTATSPVPAVALEPGPGPAAVVVRVRVIRGSRKGPAKVDPRLSDLKNQLGKLAYLTWEQVKEEQLTMVDKKTQFVDLPNKDHVGLTLQEVRGDTVTFEVAMAQRNTMSRLTIDKVKRIVHQVTSEKAGEAYFITARAAP